MKSMRGMVGNLMMRVYRAISIAVSLFGRQYSWDQGIIETIDFQETMLSDIEVANKNLIAEYEKEVGYR